MNQQLAQIHDLIDYYRSQGAPGDQQMLIALLREAQEADGGVLSLRTLTEIAGAYGLKESLLPALIRRISSLRCETVPHKLEICGTCAKGSALRDFIEREYAVRSGAISERGKFSYRVTGCMKNCKNGPSLRWDGVLHPCATIELFERLMQAQT